MIGEDNEVVEITYTQKAAMEWVNGGYVVQQYGYFGRLRKEA